MLTAKKLETLYIAKNNPKSSEPQGEWLVQALCFASDRFAQFKYFKRSSCETKVQREANNHRTRLRNINGQAKLSVKFA